jgi:exonuclease SbcC
MIIETIKLKNFLSHRDSEISLGTGINIILGQNGSGKSSIFESMKVAFFGQSESDRSRVVSYGQNIAKIYVKFRINSHEYEITREIENKRDKENTKSAVLLMDGKILAEGATAVSEQIQNLMGISKSAFINSIYVDQGQIDALVKDSPATRKDLFNEVIGLKNYDKAFDEIDKITKVVNQEINDIDLLKDKFKELEIGYNKLHESEIVLLAKNKTITDNLKAAKDTYTKNEEQYKQFLHLSSSIKNLEDDIDKEREGLKFALQNIKDIEADLETLNDLRENRKKIEVDPLYIYGQNLALLEKIIIDEKRYFQEIERCKNSISELINMEKHLTELELKVHEYDQKEKELISKEKEFDLLKKDHFNLENIKSELIKLENIKSERGGKLELLETKLPLKIKEENLNLSEIQKYLDSIRITDTDLKIKLKSASDKIIENKSLIKKIEEKIDNLNNVNNCPLCGQILSEDHLAKVLKQYRDEIDSYNSSTLEMENLTEACRRKMSIIKGEITSFLSPIIEEYFKLKEEIQKIDSDIKEKKDHVLQLYDSEKKYSELQSYLMENEGVRVKFQEIQRNKSSLEGKIDQMKKEHFEEKIKELSFELESIEKNKTSMKDSIELWENGKRSDDFEVLKSELKIIDHKLAKIESAENKSKELKIQIENFNKSISEKVGKIISIKSEIDEFSSSEQRRNDISNLIDNLQDERISLQAELSSNQEKMKSIKEIIEENKKRLTELSERKKIFDFLVLLRKAFNRDGIPQIIRKIALESINSITRNIISRFNLSVEDIKISEDLDVEIMQNGFVKNISQLSGGERTAVSIAMRLAIAKYLGRNISTIMMDEPTVYLDEERRNDLKDILQYSMKDLSDEGIFPQIVIITHHPELETAADIAYHVTKKDGNSVIDVVV